MTPLLWFETGPRHTAAMTPRSMRSLLLPLLLALAAHPAHAHEDTMLRIAKDGAIVGLPDAYGKIRVDIDYTADRDVRSLVFSGQDFRVKLRPCVLKRLKGIALVQASGSWYHDLERHPPYVSLQFMQVMPSKENGYGGGGVGMSFSVIDGRILLAERKIVPWIGNPHTRASFDATTCAKWDELWSLF